MKYVTLNAGRVGGGVKEESYTILTLIASFFLLFFCTKGITCLNIPITGEEYLWILLPTAVSLRSTPPYNISRNKNRCYREWLRPNNVSLLSQSLTSSRHRHPASTERQRRKNFDEFYEFFSHRKLRNFNFFFRFLRPLYFRVNANYEWFFKCPAIISKGWKTVT